MADVPISCCVAAAVLLEEGATPPRMLILRRAVEQLHGEWCHVAGKIENGETAWQSVLREIQEETGLAVTRVFSADYTEQFYEVPRNVVSIVPAFVAYVDASQPVRLNAEHSEYRWVTIADAQALVTLGGNAAFMKRCNASSSIASPLGGKKSRGSPSKEIGCPLVRNIASRQPMTRWSWRP